MSPPKLCSEADVVRTLRAGTYTLDELYRLCQAGTDTARDRGRDSVDCDRHRGDLIWKRRVRNALQHLRVKGQSRRLGRAVWALQGSVAQPSRLLLVLNGTASDFELRVQAATDLLSSLDAPCDLLVTDPPYGLGVDELGFERLYARDSSRVIPGYRDVPADEYRSFTHEWMAAAAAALRPGGQIAVITGPQRAGIVHLAGEDAGLTWISSIAAVRSFPLFTRRRPACAHWTVTVMTQGERNNHRRIFNAPVDLPLSRNGNPYPLDVWMENGRADRPGQLRNANELPTPLLHRIVYSFSDQGQHIVDPYGGALNLARVCRTLQRRFTGGDLNPNAIRLGAARLLLESTTVHDHQLELDVQPPPAPTQTGLFAS